MAPPLFSTLNQNELIKMALIAGGAYLLIKHFAKDKFETMAPITATASSPASGVLPPAISAEALRKAAPSARAPAEADRQAELDKLLGKSTAAKQLTAEDLLPKYDDANEFAKQNPVSKLLKEQNFLVSGHHVGLNTVLQSNKIPYHDIRSAPPIPKQEVGPWNQSSYEQGAGESRRFFEIGSS